MRTIGGLSLVAVTLVLLTGCVPEPAPVPSPSATSTPTPTATAATRPVSTFGLRCADLIPLSTVASVLGSQVDPIPTQTAADFQTPRGISVEAVGGLSCLWSNGRSSGEQGFDTDPALRSARVSVLPAASAEWEQYSKRYGLTGEPGQSVGPTCFVGGTEVRPLGVCSGGRLVGEAWVDVLFEGIGDDAKLTDDEAAEHANRLLDAIQTSLTPVASNPRVLWSGAAGTAALPDTCDGFLPQDRMSEVLDAGTELEYQTVPNRGSSVESVAMQDAGTTFCYFSMLGSDSGAGSLSIAKGGSWGYDLVRRLVSAKGAAEVVSLDGLQREDAFIACRQSDFQRCILNISFEGNWIQISTSPVDGDYARTDEQLRARAVDLGNAILTTVRG